mgnify:FL=1
MTDQEQSGSNPEIGMKAADLESAEASQDQSEGSEAFFEGLENTVNSGIQDVQDTEATQSQTSGPEQATHESIDYGSNNVTQSNNGTDWQKRYTDSSREAVKWRDRYKEVEAFVPVLDAMKQDSGLVDHVRDYLQNGGAPAKSIQEQLNLEEDFEFDQQEAMTNPESDSAKVMNAHVDGLVQQRVGQMIQKEQQRATQIHRAKAMKTEEVKFMRDNNMTEEQYEEFKKQARGHKMTLNDVHFLLNRDKAAKNVADNTKQDMINQMKNVRNMPTSASGANSQGETISQDRNVFESILGFDDSVDNLFG